MADELDGIKTVLSTWNNANTDGVTPTIDFSFNYKRTALGGGDYCFIYSLPGTQEPSSLGYTSRNKFDYVSIDISTFGTRAHFIKMRDEVERLIYASRASFTGYSYIKITRRNDQSNKSIKLRRMVFDVEMIKFCENL